MTTVINLSESEDKQLESLSAGITTLNAWLESMGASPRVLVNKNGKLCGPNSQGELVEYTKDSLAVVARMECQPEKMDSKGVVTASPSIPRPLVTAYMDGEQWDGIPKVRVTARAPIVRPDFSVRWEPGWDEPTHCWVLPGLEKDMSLVDVGFDITRIFKFFPFVDERLVADCVAAALTPLLSTAIEGSLPSFLVTARKPGSGKSELAKFCSILGNGGREFTTWRKSEEMQKLISSFAVEDRRVVIFDNIKRSIDSADLESAITARKLTFRSMGTHVSKSVPCNTSWFFTANGASMSSDLLRRSIVVLLDKDANPKAWIEDNNGARGVRFVEQNEAALVTALLDLVEQWAQAGCVRGNVAHSGFEEWSEIVSGILDQAGIEGFWEARDEILPSAVQTDEDDEMALVEAIALIMEDLEHWSAAEMYGRAMDPMLFMGFGGGIEQKETARKMVAAWIQSTTPRSSSTGEVGGGGVKTGVILKPYVDKVYPGLPYKIVQKRTASKRGYTVVPVVSGTAHAEPAESVMIKL